MDMCLLNYKWINSRLKHEKTHKFDFLSSPDLLLLPNIARSYASSHFIYREPMTSLAVKQLKTVSLHYMYYFHFLSLCVLYLCLLCVFSLNYVIEMCCYVRDYYFTIAQWGKCLFTENRKYVPNYTENCVTMRRRNEPLS